MLLGAGVESEIFKSFHFGSVLYIIHILIYFDAYILKKHVLCQISYRKHRYNHLIHVTYNINHLRAMTCSIVIKWSIINNINLQISTYNICHQQTLTDNINHEMKQSIIIPYSIPKSCKIIRCNQQFKVQTSKVGSNFKIQMPNFQSSK